MEELDAQSFDEKISHGQGIAVVDFWAPWCGPCRVFAPQFEQASKEAPSVFFGKLNVDEVGAVAQRFGVMSIPTVIFFKDGKPVEQFAGARPKEEIIKIIQRLK